jgi:hypothetical protein
MEKKIMMLHQPGRAICLHAYYKLPLYRNLESSIQFVDFFTF